MAEQENKNRGLYDYIEKYEGDITYRARAFESHSSKEFINMNKRFKSKVCRRTYEPKMRDMVEYIDVCEEEYN